MITSPYYAKFVWTCQVIYVTCFRSPAREAFIIFQANYYRLILQISAANLIIKRLVMIKKTKWRVFSINTLRLFFVSFRLPKQADLFWLGFLFKQSTFIHFPRLSWRNCFYFKQ